MVQLLSRRHLAAVAAATSSVLAAAVLTPGLAQASPRVHAARSKGTTVVLESSSKYGKILADKGGRTLYLLTANGSTSLACTGTCAAVWPPLLTVGKPRAGAGVEAKMLGTVKRGSSLQVTYAGHPLYLYSGDSAAHQVNGEGIASFGGTWYVLASRGAPVKAASSGSGSSSSSSGSGGW